MAITRSFAPAYCMGLSAVPTESAPEANSQTFKQGAVLIPQLTSSAITGYVVTGAADPTLGTILGVAARAGQNVTTKPDTQYTPALPNVVFEGQLYHSSASSAVIAATDRFQAYGIAVDSSGNWYVDKTDTTNDRVKVIGFKDAVGTTNGVVYFTFLSEGTIWGVELT